MAVSGFSSVVVALCVLAAIAAIIVGGMQLLPQPVRVRRHLPGQNRLSGFLLVLSAAGWAGLGQHVLQRDAELADAASVAAINELPMTAAGIPASFGDVSRPATAIATARVATAAEELAEQPHAPDFQRLRQSVLGRLFNHGSFDNPPEPVLIDLSSDTDRDMIKYLVEERPGLLTLIYHRDAEDGRAAIVYFPTAAGNQLIYTPVMGGGTEPVSKLVNSELKQAGISP